ncbi:hypothetical protein F0562_018974 [Nyssa sinensis]|uniref:Apple domain-containing protein n=1 Tax=Nyssa sinensis TaxID=561372 RepID=A0A5J4ZA12_9ASTE|nr:hypothetical protein F0562_018974 [Nyssa sinensis]
MEWRFGRGSEDIKECQEKCLKNFSCNANSLVSGISCMIWSGDLVDFHHFPQSQWSCISWTCTQLLFFPHLKGKKQSNRACASFKY